MTLQFGGSALCAVFIATFIGGCTSTSYQMCRPDTYIKTYDVSYCGQKPDAARIADYISAFEIEWAHEEFSQNPEAINEAFNSISIHWQDHVFTAPGLKPRLLGLTYYPFIGNIDMYVYVPNYCHDLQCTSFGHELIHVAYGAAFGDMISDHLEGGIEWPQSHMEFLARVNQRYSQIDVYSFEAQ